MRSNRRRQDVSFFPGIRINHLDFLQAGVIKAVIDRQDEPFARQDRGDLALQQAHRRIGFLGGPELRLFTPPYIHDAPFAIAHAVAPESFGFRRMGKLFPERRSLLRLGQLERLVDISPDSATQSTTGIKQAAPHHLQRLAPELADVRIGLQSLIRITGRMRPFVEDRRNAFALEAPRRAVPLVQVSVYILIMHTQQVVDRLAVAQRARITEDHGARRIGCLYPVPRLLEILPIDTLVADRPE